MEIKTFSDDLYSVITTRAKNQSIKYYQTFCGTSHLFLAAFGFLATNKDNERYKPVYDGLREILNKYGVDGKTFEQHFLQFCPRGEAPSSGETFKIQVDGEYTKVIDVLKRKAMKERRTMEIEDLILELFGDSSYNLETIFTDITGSANKTEEMYNEVVKKFKKAVAKEIKEFKDVPELTNLNEWVKQNPQKIIDGKEEIMKIEMALSGRSVKNALLIGPAGTGKTTYVYGFAQDINNGCCPEQFSDKVVYQLDSTALMSGTRYRGDLEEKLTNILEVVKKNPQVILFIDEIHMLIKMNGTDDGGQSVGNMLKPYMTRGDIQVIGATTNEEFTKHMLPDKAFCSRFSILNIKEPTKAATKEILTGMLPVETEFFKREVQEELVDKIIALSDKYALEYANPRKSINMLELACAYSRVFEEKKQVVDPEDIINSIKLRYNIYISDDKIRDTKEGFKQVLGQEEAVNQIMRDLDIVDAEITDPQRPALSMLFCGPSGYTVAPLF